MSKPTVFYEVVESPDDGGFYSYLINQDGSPREPSSPILETSDAAEQWAIAQGGKRKI